MNEQPKIGLLQNPYGTFQSGEPNPKDVSNIVTGTMLFRDQGPAPTGDGRKMVLVIGMLAVPANSRTFTNGHMTAVAELVPHGMPHLASALSGDTMLMVSKESWAPFIKDGDDIIGLVDVAKHTPGSLVTLPIWRV